MTPSACVSGSGRAAQCQWSQFVPANRMPQEAHVAAMSPRSTTMDAKKIKETLPYSR